jgi:uncharacterized delta-60 repeat protein
MRHFLLLATLFVCVNPVISQPGKLDSTYGNLGIVTATLGIPVSVHSSGKQVLLGPGGSSYIVLEFPAAITKRLANGLADPGFGYNGFAMLPTINDALAVVQPDGKIVVSGNGFAVARLNSNGMPDPTFKNSGTPLPGFENSSAAKSLAIQDDGKIVAAGTYRTSNGETYFATVRYTADGILDPTFNGNGQVITDFEITWVPPGRNPNPVPLHVAQASAAVIQPDGKILVGGFINAGYHLEFAIARYNSDGRPDSTFNDDGREHTEFQSSSAMANSIRLQPDGKILLGGSAGDGISSGFAVARYTPNGVPDSTFNDDGRQTVKPLSGSLSGRSLDIQSNGKILLAGDNTSEFVIARLNADGSHDQTFDEDGTVNINFPASYTQANAMAVQPDDKIIITGYASNPSNLIRLAIARLQADGNLDASFGDQGKILDNFKRSQTEFRSSVIQDDGKLVAAGLVWNGTNNDFVVARYNVNGKPDSTFDSDGIQTTDFGGKDEAVAVLIQAGGKIVVSGNSDNRFAIARYNADGTPDNLFSGDGKITIPVGFADVAQSAALQADGKILVAGHSFNDANFDSSRLAIIRVNLNGTTDNTFSGDGILLADVGSSRMQGGFVAVQNDGKIVLGGSVRRDKYNLLALRYHPDGSVDNSFSGDGFQLYDFGSDEFNISDLVIHDDGKIVAGGYSQTGNSSAYSFVLARISPDGSPDSSLSDDGYQRTSFDAGTNFARSVAIWTNGTIAVGGQIGNHFGIALYKASGVLDSAFGTNGVQKTQIGVTESRINSLVFTNNYLYAAGYANLSGTFGAVTRYVIEETILPLSFLDLRANLQNNSVLLRWNVVTAKDPEKFIIERSADGRNFSPIHTLAAEGVGTLAKEFSGLDARPLKTLNYYRVHMRGRDGSSQYSNVVAIRLANNNKLSIFPVPAKNTLYVQAYGDHAYSDVTIVNSAGVALKKFRVLLNNNTYFSVDVSQFASGLYHLVISSNGQTEVKTFIKH